MNECNLVLDNTAKFPTHAIMPSKLSTAILCALLIACSIAHAGTRHGDVTLTNNDGFSSLPAAADWLIFPSIPIGRRSVVVYHVRSLPQVIYPSGFDFEVPEAEYLPLREAPRNAPWRDCIIRASLATPDGARFFSRTIALGRGSHGAELKGNRSKAFFLFTDYQPNGTTRLPHHLSYDLQIEVLRPSLRASDKLSVQAFTTSRRAKTTRKSVVRERN